MLVGRAKPASGDVEEVVHEAGIDQQRLPIRRSFIAYPWDLPEPASPDDIVATERHDLANVERPPPQLARIPDNVDRMPRRFGAAVRGLGPGPGPRLVFERLGMTIRQWAGVLALYARGSRRIGQRLTLCGVVPPQARCESCDDKAGRIA